MNKAEADFFSEAFGDNDKHECPNCHFIGEAEVSIRQGIGEVYGISCNVVQVGFKCVQCSHEWGFI